MIRLDRSIGRMTTKMFPCLLFRSVFYDLSTVQGNEEKLNVIRKELRHAECENQQAERKRTEINGV